MKKIQIGVVGLLVVWVMPLVAFSWPVPDTGQTTCYDTVGNVINCRGTGQDGEFSINPHSYTSLGGGTMVVDNVTGLMWAVKTDDGSIHDKDNTYNWNDATDVFIAALNTNKFGGYADWRLPTVKELSTLVDAEGFNPAIDPAFFPNTVSGYFWSSSSYAGNLSNGWNVIFDDGRVYGNADAGNDSHVRAVRGGEPSSAYVDNGDGTVTDTDTGLMWQQVTPDGDYTWPEALDYCNGLTLAGHIDWRLPNRNEIQSLVDYGRYDPSIDETFFGGTEGIYWSSSSYADYPADAWGVGFYGGGAGNGDKSGYGRVRAVRAGQNRLTGHLIISTPIQGSRWNNEAGMPITWDPAGISGSVAISLSRQGGRPGSWETIATTTPNDGSFQWTVSLPYTYNAMIKIEPVSNPAKGTVQGLFSIVNDVSVDPLNLTISEPSVEASFTIKLNKAPSAEVIIDLTTTNPGEFTLVDGSNNRANEMTVTLDGTNWQTGVDVAVRAESDNTLDGDQVSQVLTATVRSDDPDFSGLHIANVSVTVKDDEAGISVDSVYPTYGTVGTALDVTVRGLGFVSGTTRVFITPSGGSEIEITPVTVDDAETLHVTIPSPASAVDYDLKVHNNGTVTDVLPAAVSFAANVTAQRAKKAIIMAGGGSFIDNDMWLSTRRNANHAYAALFGQGYEADAIQYLGPGFEDVTGDGANDVDDDATMATLENAIKNWPFNTSPTATDLMIYLVGPGEPGKFYLKRTEGYEMALTTATLDGWLNTVKPSLSGDLILIVDAPASGGFLTGLTNSRPLVITGSTGSERSWYLDDGEISFSWPFWEAIYNGGELFGAFDHAKATIGGVQTPGIDATGDGTPDPRSRTRSTDTLSIGRARSVETDPPIIGATFPDTVITSGTEADLWAYVTADNVVSQVWARIYPPMEAVQPDNRPVLVLPTVKLNDTDGDDRYSNTYEEFIYQGDYKTFIHASDKREYHALPKMALVTQNTGMAFDSGDLDMDGDVTIADAIIALRAVVDLPIPRTLHLEPTGDDRLGVQDALLILQWVSGARLR